MSLACTLQGSIAVLVNASDTLMIGERAALRRSEHALRCSYIEMLRLKTID